VKWYQNNRSARSGDPIEPQDRSSPASARSDDIPCRVT
jgi:hypothetical protein